VLKWVKPNILKDLETVFEGAREQWKREQHEPGAAGRGDFILASGLLPLLDHFGSLLAEPKWGWITPPENIARACLRLGPDLADIFAVFANLARNALLHGAWPQTACIVDVPVPGGGIKTWAFGVSFNANADSRRHDTFHNKAYRLAPNLPPPEKVPERTLKLVLNVHNLRSRLVEAVESGTLFRGVRQFAFDRVRKISELSGDTNKDRRDKLLGLAKPGRYDPKRLAKVRRRMLCKENSVNDQIAMLFAEAERLGALRSAEDEKIRRDHKGYGGLSTDEKRAPV